MTTYRGIPIAATNIFIRISACRRQEISSLWDVFFSLLSPDFHLLFLTTAPKIILLQSPLAFVGCGRWKRVRTKQSWWIDGKNEPSLRAFMVRDSALLSMTEYLFYRVAQMIQKVDGRWKETWRGFETMPRTWLRQPWRQRGDAWLCHATSP